LEGRVGDVIKKKGGGSREKGSVERGRESRTWFGGGGIRSRLQKNNGGFAGRGVLEGLRLLREDGEQEM